MKIPVLPTAVFLSLALNLFLIGVIAGTWREMRGSPASGPVPGHATPPASLSPDPGLSAPADRDLADAPPAPSGALGPASTPSPPPVDTPDPRPAGTATRAPEVAAPGPDGARGVPPPSSIGPLRPPAGNPLMMATRELPEREGMALRALLRVESEAVRAVLIQARRERAAAWRALARGEVNEAEASRRLDMARRHESAARGQVESAVAEWALRQSPEVRARIGEALARDAQPRGRYPVRPDPPSARPLPGLQGAAGGS